MTWQELTLAHYSGEPFDGGPIRLTDLRGSFAQSKPRGFWVSVDGENDWADWCVAEDWRLDGLKHRYVVRLKPEANILHLDTEDALRALTNVYGRKTPYGDEIRGMDWDAICRQHDGIIIAPYQWSCRLDDQTFWYSGWDCASGCVWNLDAIESFTLDESWVVPKRNEDAA